jgi:hypothetical protein
LYQEISETHEELRKLAFYDELTNLPNRKKIIRELNELCEMRKDTQQPFAVVFMDLDNFKESERLSWPPRRRRSPSDCRHLFAKRDPPRRFGRPSRW